MAGMCARLWRRGDTDHTTNGVKVRERARTHIQLSTSGVPCGDSAPKRMPTDQYLPKQNEQEGPEAQRGALEADLDQQESYLQRRPPQTCLFPTTKQ